MTKGDLFYLIDYGKPTAFWFSEYTDGSCFHPAGTIKAVEEGTATLRTIEGKKIYPGTYQGYVDCCKEAQSRLDAATYKGLQRWQAEVLRDERITGENARMEAAGTEYQVTQIATAVQTKAA